MTYDGTGMVEPVAADFPRVDLGKLAIRSARVDIEHACASDYVLVRVTLWAADAESRFDPPLVTPVIAVNSQMALASWLRASAQRRGEWIRQVVIDAFAHEVDEWLRVDGARVRDPHPEAKADVTVRLAARR